MVKTKVSPSNVKQYTRGNDIRKSIDRYFKSRIESQGKKGYDGSVESLVGLKLINIRLMTDSEINAEGWDDSKVLALEFEDGTILYPSQDEEGNGAGNLIGADNDGETFYVSISDKSLIGKKIKLIRPLSNIELNNEGWDYVGTTSVLEFEDGTKIYASSDEEGNNGGTLFGRKKGKNYYVFTKKRVE